MAGYRNRTIRLTFEELSEDGDPVFIVLRNPRTVPTDQLIPRDVDTDAQGNPLDKEDARLANSEPFARLIVNWHVYDASVEADDQPLLALPATAQDVLNLPLEIQNRLIEEVNRARNPTRTPATSTP
jgi:hypothetical protein